MFEFFNNFDLNNLREIIAFISGFFVATLLLTTNWNKKK